MQILNPADLAAEIPYLKWYRNLDVSFILLMMISFVLHVLSIGYLHSLPVPEVPLKIKVGILEMPPIPQVYMPEDETFTPEPALPGQAGNDPGGTSGSPELPGKPSGMIAVLENNQDILELITREGPNGPYIRGVSSLPSESINLDGGVRLARRGDREAPGIGNDGNNALPVTTELNSLRPMGTVNVGEREARKIEVSLARPIIQGGSPDANRLVRQALYNRQPAVKHCYEKALNANSNLRGKIKVHVGFGTDGNVNNAGLLENTITDPSVGQCVLQVLRGVKIKEGLSSEVSVSVPYIFTSID